MSSINTNVAAMTALQTLSQTNKSLTETQNRISTGMRVNEASDNAAYWSIATTMRSDNKALSAVQDALGLGAATVDTAYTGLNAAIEVVDEIKSKLVTARGEGVDRAKIQSDIEELQGQLRGIGEAAVIPGADNWLSTDSSVADYNATKNIVSSFTRVAGSVTVQTIGVDTSTVKMYDASTAATVDGSAAITGSATFTATAVGAGDATDTTGSFTVAVDTGASYTVTVSQDDSISDIATKINKLGVEGLTVGISDDGTTLHFASRNENEITITNSATAGDDGGLGADVTLTQTAYAASEKGILDKAQDYYDGTAWQTFTVDNLDISELTNSMTDLATLDSFIAGVDAQLDLMTDAATNLGSTKSRIDLQSGFAKDLMDAIDRGIGQLVDADMNEESTRLQALQVKQQLGIQALSIANSSSQSILSLFRG